jgi:hypothetical protein
MSNDVPWWVTVIVAWLPFLVLVGTALWMIATLRATLRTRDGRSLADVMSHHAQEMQRANDLLRDAIEAQRQGRTKS